ncbi:MAG: hypothetical protein GY853_09110 [PVC group bacterium]|nr:hypothetical protein [PVC group bacterium]
MTIRQVKYSLIFKCLAVIIIHAMIVGNIAWSADDNYSSTSIQFKNDTLSPQVVISHNSIQQLFSINLNKSIDETAESNVPDKNESILKTIRDEIQLLWTFLCNSDEVQVLIDACFKGLVVVGATCVLACVLKGIPLYVISVLWILGLGWYAEYRTKKNAEREAAKKNTKIVHESGYVFVFVSVFCGFFGAIAVMMFSCVMGMGFLTAAIITLFVANVINWVEWIRYLGAKWKRQDILFDILRQTEKIEQELSGKQKQGIGQTLRNIIFPGRKKNKSSSPVVVLGEQNSAIKQVVSSFKTTVEEQVQKEFATEEERRSLGRIKFIPVDILDQDLEKIKYTLFIAESI